MKGYKNVKTHHKTIMAKKDIEKKLTPAQIKVMETLLSHYLIDVDLQKNIIENIEKYTDPQCNRLTETLEKNLKVQDEVLNNIGNNYPELAKKLIDAKKNSKRDYVKTLEAKERTGDQKELDKLEEDLNEE